MPNDMLSRRAVLKASGIGVASSVAGCLGGGGGGSSVKPIDITEFPVSDVEETFNLWNWYDGFAQYTQEQMPKEYSNLSTVNVSGYAASSEWYSKLQAGQHSIDNVASTTQFTSQAMDNDLSEPLPIDSMPNWEHALETTRQNMKDWYTDDDGNVHAVPHVIGLWPALGYNADYFDNEPMSWDVLWDSELKGKITMQDQAIVSGFVAARYTGQEFANPSDFADIKEALLQQKELVKTYWKEYEVGMRMFMNKDVHAGTHTMGRLYNANFLQDAKHVQYSIPKEGALYFVDNLMIPKDAPHPRVATAYCNWSLDPAIAVNMFTSMGYLPAVDIKEQLQQADLPQGAASYVSWSKDQRDRLIPWEPLSADVREQYNQIWTEVKAA